MNFDKKLNLLYKTSSSKIPVIVYYNDPATSLEDVRKCKVVTNEQSFDLIFDERFNEIDFIYNDNPDDPFKYSNILSDYLTFKFNQLKSTDFRYRLDEGIEGTKRIRLEDYINFLKKENRDLLINSIL